MVRSYFWLFVILAIIVLVLFFPIFEVIGMLVLFVIMLATVWLYVRWRSKDEDGN